MAVYNATLQFTTTKVDEAGEHKHSNSPLEWSGLSKANLAEMEGLLIDFLAKLNAIAKERAKAK